MDKRIEHIAEKLAEGGRNVVFTGAGISTESGISDYRSKGGIWNRYKPVYFQEFLSSRDARIEYWRRKVDLHSEMRNAQPNAAHCAVADMHRAGTVEAVITQNIDGLHQMAGVPDDAVVELHGNTRRVRCLSCGAVSPVEDAVRRILGGELAPECECGGYLKPDTISFGQDLCKNTLDRAFALSETADTFLVVGSTLLVQPAAALPQIAHRNAAFLAIVNLSETTCDTIADVLIPGKAGDVLPQIARCGASRLGV